MFCGRSAVKEHCQRPNDARRGVLSPIAQFVEIRFRVELRAVREICSCRTANLFVTGAAPDTNDSPTVIPPQGGITYLVALVVVEILAIELEANSQHGVAKVDEDVLDRALRVKGQPMLSYFLSRRGLNRRHAPIVKVRRDTNAREDCRELDVPGRTYGVPVTPLAGESWFPRCGQPYID